MPHQIFILVDAPSTPVSLHPEEERLAREELSEIAGETERRESGGSRYKGKAAQLATVVVVVESGVVYAAEEEVFKRGTVATTIR
uniref:Protein-L-isoaspartate O-methyltransferase 1 isoform X2 n=1 Tax=Rhizophora mucronata TaxID=61149 RepID=A0A2P2IWX8_RHIMU